MSKQLAVVTARFRGRADGETRTKRFYKGDRISGELAAAMVEAGYAEWQKEDKAKAAPANKANASAPKNKAAG